MLPHTSALAETRDQRVKKQKAAFNAAQKAMSKFVLKRDPICVTCGKNRSTEMGHFIHSKHGILYFCDYNVHGQCTECNQFKGSNHEAYRDYIVKRYGKPILKMLESIGKRIHDYSIEELELIKKKYTEESPRPSKRLFFGTFFQ